jgi:hypothetical protein
MPKKRVGVSLRKPSPAPERAALPVEVPVASVEAPVASVEAVLREATAIDVASAPVADAEVVLAESAVAAVPSADERSSEAAASLIAALVASEPSASPVVAPQIDAFVNGAAAVLERAASEVPAEKLEELLQQGREGYRQLTVFLPEALADALTVHCQKHDLDLSQLIATAVEHHLNAAKAAVSAALSSESVLSIAARSLIGDLAGWVRTVLTTRRRSWRTSAVAG